MWDEYDCIHRHKGEMIVDTEGPKIGLFARSEAEDKEKKSLKKIN